MLSAKKQKGGNCLSSQFPPFRFFRTLIAGDSQNLPAVSVPFWSASIPSSITGIVSVNELVSLSGLPRRQMSAALVIIPALPAAPVTMARISHRGRKTEHQRHQQ